MPSTITVIPLVITAGLLSLVLLWPRIVAGPSHARLATEMFVSTFALFALALGLMVTAQRLSW